MAAPGPEEGGMDAAVGAAVTVPAANAGRAAGRAAAPERVRVAAHVHQSISQCNKLCDLVI